MNWHRFWIRNVTDAKNAGRFDWICAMVAKSLCSNSKAQIQPKPSGSIHFVLITADNLRSCKMARMNHIYLDFLVFHVDFRILPMTYFPCSSQRSFANRIQRERSATLIRYEDRMVFLVDAYTLHALRKFAESTTTKLPFDRWKRRNHGRSKMEFWTMAWMTAKSLSESFWGKDTKRWGKKLSNDVSHVIIIHNQNDEFGF